MAPISLNINIAAPAADYYADAYPLDLLIKTSGGTRLIRFNAPPKVTQQDYDRLTAGLLVALGDCQQLVDPWARLHGGYNPRWSPRPPEGYAVKHLWQVVVSGLPGGERVALVDELNQQLISVVSTGAPMRLMSVVEPGGEKELTIKNMGRVEGAVQHNISRVERATVSDTQRAGIEVTQTLLIKLGFIPLHEKCERISIVNLYERQTVIAIHKDSLSFYDFSNSSIPVLVKTIHIGGVAGVLKWQDSVIAYGEEGIQHIGQMRRDVACEAGRILSATVDRTAFYALTSERLHMYSKKFCKINELHCEDAKSIIRVGNQLLVGGRNGILRLNANEPHSCESERLFEDINVRRLRPTYIGEPGSFIAELEDGGAKVFQLNERSVEEVADCETLPWLNDTVRSGNYLVKVGEDRMTLEVYQYGETALVGAEGKEDK